MQAPRKDWLPLSCIAALPFVLFWRLALLQAAVNTLDIQLTYFPQRKLLADLIHQGVLPLWNPFEFSGEPLLGNGQFGYFYPPNWLFFFLPPVAALNYYVLLNLAIAGAGMYLLARGAGLKIAPGCLAAVAYMFSGPVVARIVHYDILGSCAMLPWVTYFAFRALRNGNWLSCAAAAFAVALQLAAGHPQVPVYAAALLALYALLLGAWRLFCGLEWRQCGTPLARVLVIYLLAAGLAAVHLLPWFALARLSVRAAGAPAGFTFAGLLERKHLLLFLFPYFEGSIGSGLYSVKPVGTGTLMWEHACYIGMVTLWLALVACLKLFPEYAKLSYTREPQKGEVRILELAGLVIMAAAASLFVIGRPAFLRSVFTALPVIGQFRHFGRPLVFAGLAISVLAGYGLQTLGKPPDLRWRRRLRYIAVAAALLPAGLAFSISGPLGRTLFHLDSSLFKANFGLLRANALVPVAMGLATAALFAWWSVRPVTRGAGGAAIALVTVDLALFAVPFFPTVSPDFFALPPRAADFLRHDRSLFRKATFTPVRPEGRYKELLFPQWGFISHIQDIAGFSSLETRRYADYLQAPGTRDVSSGSMLDERLLAPADPVLNSLNVKYILVPASFPNPARPRFKPVYADDQVRILENLNVLPRAYFARTVRCESDPPRILAAVTAPGFDPQSLALVEGCASASLHAEPPAPTDRIFYIRWSFNEFSISTSAGGSRFLLLSEIYFPGWRAEIDGKSAAIYRTNYVFRGLPLPPGEHEISFRYAPRTAEAGLGVSLAAAVLIGFLLRRERRRQAAK